MPEPPIYRDEVYDNLPCMWGRDLAATPGPKARRPAIDRLRGPVYAGRAHPFLEPAPSPRIVWGSPMSERQRRFHRIPIEALKGRLHTPRDLTVRDLSRTGMAFETSEPLEEGKDYFVELSYRGQSIRLAVNVRWVKPEEAGRGEPPAYQVGAEFVDILEKPDTGLWDWIGVAGEGGAEGEDEEIGWPP